MAQRQRGRHDSHGIYNIAVALDCVTRIGKVWTQIETFQKPYVAHQQRSQDDRQSEKNHS